MTEEAPTSSAGMTEEVKELILKDVNLHCPTNNFSHHTSEISLTELFVRRGLAFTLTLTLSQPFKPKLYPLSMVAITGLVTSEEQGTISYFGIPDSLIRSPSAKAVWKAALEEEKSSPEKGVLVLNITPPANAPIGSYVLTGKYREEDMLLAMPVVFFNPWCPDDTVYLSDEKERQEYVMSEQGIIYGGSGNYISDRTWDFGQFEDDMARICIKLLDVNPKHAENPADDVCSRSDPVYVSRVISAMINSEGDHGVVMGRWGGPFTAGYKPTHWTGSHAILKRWYDYGCQPVRYGQCWVFAGVMCSVMRLLGIPCRVVTNYESAHDTNKNLIIDVYYADYGVAGKKSPDSVWNYHLWVEGWMKRPDLEEGDKYDGWQVLDPTPQEKSNGVYCCGPASVKAIRSGNIDLKYDIPFIFAEVNADCVDWLVKADGSKIKLFSDTKRIGQNISTKSVGLRKRMNITDTYKHREGSDKERDVFKYALTRDLTIDKEEGDSGVETENDTGAENQTGGAGEETEGNGAVIDTSGGAGEETEGNGAVIDTSGGAGEETEGNGAVIDTSGGAGEGVPEVTPPSDVSMRFEELSEPMNGKDVSMKLLLHSKSTSSRLLSINISVQAMGYNGSSAGNIQSKVKEETMQPGTELSVPILVPFSAYHKLMVECDSMKVTAMVNDKYKPEQVYLAENDIVLMDPPFTFTVSSTTRLQQETSGVLIFKNPVDETLTGCTLTLSGSGIFKKEEDCRLPDLEPKQQVRINIFFYPYKTGKKTITAVFDCSTFRDIQTTCKIEVKE
ncbi:protein-glutamine gamma-glutamyltransferase 2 [Pleuronectes platessa]|uniref:protein-glutamine gamma-glutamyltransferase 2 n=1 Tax=Pleuronectes platessa TaxID=8262 RepID=UPI00232A75CC|nr:protein-glutamine gamma-glutamyltransferase 2 [Pleuronectes platessa]